VRVGGWGGAVSLSVSLSVVSLSVVSLSVVSLSVVVVSVVVVVVVVSVALSLTIDGVVSCLTINNVGPNV